jgi:hypothetical protein
MRNRVLPSDVTAYAPPPHTPLHTPSIPHRLSNALHAVAARRADQSGHTASGGRTRGRHTERGAQESGSIAILPNTSFIMHA